MSFEEFCDSKKINAEKFRVEDLELFSEMKEQFEQMSPQSFNQQKLFLINGWRHSYKVEITEPIKEKPADQTKKVGPKIPARLGAIKMPSRK